MNTNNNEHADELNQTMVYLDTQDTHTFLQASALDMDDEAEDTSLTSVKSIITTDQQQKNTDKVPSCDSSIWIFSLSASTSCIFVAMSFPLFVEI
jgi:hypothetical protein